MAHHYGMKERRASTVATPHGPRDDAAWRASVLTAAGVAPQAADAIAGHTGIDVHALVSLVERGCPVHLALRLVHDGSAAA